MKIRVAPSLETRKKISETLKNKGIKPPSRLGIFMSDEQKEILKKVAKEKGFGKWMKGRNWTKDIIEKRIKTRKINGWFKNLEQTKRKISKRNMGIARLYLRGEKSIFWKGGITPINVKIRQSSKYRIWRMSIFERDNYTCVWCGKKGGKLEGDHIKPFSLFPELRFEIENGRTLCKDCHKKTDTYLNKIYEYKM